MSVYDTLPQYHYGWALLITTLVTAGLGNVAFLSVSFMLPSIRDLPEMPVMSGWSAYNMVLSIGCLVFCSVFSHQGKIGSALACGSQTFFATFSVVGVLLSACLVSYMSEYHIRTGRMVDKHRIFKLEICIFFGSLVLSFYCSVWPLHGAPVPSGVFCLLDFVKPAASVFIGVMIISVIFVATRYVYLTRRVSAMTALLRAHKMPLIAKQSKVRSIKVLGILVGIFVGCCVPIALFMLVDLCIGHHVSSPTMYIVGGTLFHASATLVPLIAMGSNKSAREAIKNFFYQSAPEASARGDSISRNNVSKSNLTGNPVTNELIQVLTDPETYILFLEFCETEHNEENVLFWTAAQRFREAFDRNRKESLQIAREINVLFIQEPGAPLEINISSYSRSVLSSLLTDTNTQLPITTFDRAQQEVLYLLQKDIFRRFKKSAPRQINQYKPEFVDEPNPHPTPPQSTRRFDHSSLTTQDHSQAAPVELGATTTKPAPLKRSATEPVRKEHSNLGTSVVNPERSTQEITVLSEPSAAVIDGALLSSSEAREIRELSGQYQQQPQEDSEKVGAELA